MEIEFLCQNRTGASPGTFSTVSGTARMVPAEAPTMLIGSKQSVLGSIKEKNSTLFTKVSESESSVRCSLNRVQ